MTTTYSPNFLTITDPLEATGTQDYTGLTVNPTSGGTDLVLGQGYFANFDTTADPLPALSSASWAGLGFFSEEVSSTVTSTTDTVWEPKGSYFLSETACVTPSADNVGAVTGVTVTNPGSGYTSAPDVDFTGGGGSGASADPVLSGTTVGSITVDNPGSGYTSVPTVDFTGGGGSGASATATLSDDAVSTTITIDAGGSGYTSAPTVDFTGGGGSGASATPALSGTTVGSITVTNPGSGYTSAPTVTFTGGGGNGAEANATVSDDSQRVDSRLSRITSGSLYSFYVGGASTTNLTVGATADSELISFGNSQTLATTDAANTDEANIAYIIRRADQNTEIAPFRYSGGAITSGQVGSVTVTNSGSAYTSAPDVTFTGGEGSGATATAVLSGTTVGSITVTDPGSGYTSVPAVDFTGGGGSGAEADASLIGNLQNIMMASEGATDKNHYKYDITPQKAVVSRSIGDLYTFNYPERDNTDYETYDFATGGDGVVAIGATDSFASVSEDGASDSAFTGTPFKDSSTGNFDWPLPSKIGVSDAGFLYTDDLTTIFKSRSYGHSYNMDLGLNFDLGTNDGNDINLATNWSYSDFFRGDTDYRYAKAKLTSEGSGWKIQPTFDMSGLTESFPISGISEEAAAWFVNIKNLFTTIAEPVVWIGSIVGLCTGDNYPVPANASASTKKSDWKSIPFSAPVDSSDPPISMVTTANFKDYSDVDEVDDPLSEFGLDATCLSTERSLGTTASYIKGDSHSIWKNKTGTSSVEIQFPAPDSDGGWGYWERSNFDNIVSYSQTGTIKATTSSTTKVSSDVITKEMTNSAHAISFGYTFVPRLSLGINLKGVKTVFGHTPPTKVDVDVGISRVEMTAALNKNVCTFSSIINGSKLEGNKNKTEVTFNKKVTYIGPWKNRLAGGVEAKTGATGIKVDAGATDLTSSLLSSFYNLEKVKGIGAKLQTNGARLASQNSNHAEGLGMNTAQPAPALGPTPMNAEDHVAEQPATVATADTDNKPPKAGSSPEPNITDGASTSASNTPTQATETAPVTTPGPKKKKAKKEKAFGGEFGRNLAKAVKKNGGFF